MRTVSYKIKFIDSASSLSNLVDTLEEGIHKIKCKDCSCFLKYENVNDNLVKCKCLSCNRSCSEKIGEIKKTFKNTFKFPNNNFDRFILLLIKDVYTYKYMDGWETFNETSLPKKEGFYSNLNMEDITD